MNKIAGWIREENVEWFETQIAKINKKCVKLSAPEITIEFTGNTRIQVERDNEGNIIDRFPEIEVLIDDIVPVIADWVLFATFKREDANLIMVYRQNEELKLPYEPTTITCEHCGHNRKRNKSFLLQNVNTGEFKEVGSTCLKDFTGHDPKKFLWLSELNLEELFDRERGLGRGDARYFDINEIVTISMVVVREFGWVSKNTEWETGTTSTATNVTKYLSNKLDLEITKEDRIKGEEIVNFFKNYNDENPSDYIRNIIGIVNKELVPEKLFGLACSIVKAKQTIDDKMKKAEREANRKPSEYFGEIAKRYDLELTLTFKTYFEHDFGITDMFIFEDKDENVFVWFTTSSPAFDMEVGNTFLMKGTVKDHKEYKDVKQTILSRCKISKQLEKGE